MKVAILISGSPRFCAGFDTFVHGLTGFDTADWFVDLWSDNPRPDKLGHENHVLVSPSWRKIDQEWAENKITSNLPNNHQLTALSLYDSNLIEYPTITGPQVHHVNFPSIWKMHLGWNRVGSLWQSTGNQYDLVIRARPDVCLNSPLNLITIKNLLDQSPNHVLVARDGQHGYGYNTNDVVAISLPNNISIYTDLINHSIEYNTKGIMFHPETLLAYHMHCNGLESTPILDVSLRPNAITLPDGTVTVDFGRWQ